MRRGDPEILRLPRGGGALGATGRAAGEEGGTGGGGEAEGVEYARYCMDRGATYLWGAYSNGPSLYDRDRLMRLVGRQYGEPTDRFPDPASESNYAYRVGAAGLCSAVLRVWPGCGGVLELAFARSDARQRTRAKPAVESLLGGALIGTSAATLLEPAPTRAAPAEAWWLELRTRLQPRAVARAATGLTNKVTHWSCSAAAPPQMARYQMLS